MTNTRAAHKAGRHLLLIDIENLMATPSPNAEEVKRVKATLREVVPGFDSAQSIVASSHHAAPAAAFSFPGARYLWRSGPDGADLALLGVLENERVDERFERVTICSGDGIFAAAACWLARAKVDVTVVSLAGHLAARLQLAARHVTLLPPAAPIVAAEGS
jgi:hypothetical protein